MAANGDIERRLELISPTTSSATTPSLKVLSPVRVWVRTANGSSGTTPVDRFVYGAWAVTSIMPSSGDAELAAVDAARLAAGHD